MDFIIRKTLLPVTKRTWATPCESRKITPERKDDVNILNVFVRLLAYYATNEELPIWDGLNPFFANLKICSFTSSGVSFNHVGTLLL